MNESRQVQPHHLESDAYPTHEKIIESDDHAVKDVRQFARGAVSEGPLDVREGQQGPRRRQRVIIGPVSRTSKASLSACVSGAVAAAASVNSGTALAVGCPPPTAHPSRRHRFIAPPPHLSRNGSFAASSLAPVTLDFIAQPNPQENKMQRISRPSWSWRTSAGSRSTALFATLSLGLVGAVGCVVPISENDVDSGTVYGTGGDQGGPGTGGARTGTGGATTGVGGQIGEGGSGVGGQIGTGGATTGAGGRVGEGGSGVGGGVGLGGRGIGGAMTGTGGATAGTGGRVGTGGAMTGTGGATAGTGGRVGTGGAMTGTGGAVTGTGGRITGTGGAEPGTGGKVTGTGGAEAGTGGSTGTAGATGACTAGTPLSGGKTYTSNSSGNVAGGGYSYQYWAASGGSASMTVYGVGAAFKASWSSPQDFLARVGLGWSSNKTYDQLGTISADYAYTKTGTGGSYSFIGIYGWSENPLHEYYIVDDWFGSGPPTGGGAKQGSFTVDGATYNIYTHTQTNQPAITGGNQTFVQFFSVRQTPRQCGHISISEHFAEWAKLGMTLGNMEEARILVEVGGGSGSGSIDFTSATVTAQ